ncbi:MAG: 3-hydroxyacyl-ACP dehydratase FabZ [Deltaproteobacteria bacterium]|nr:3-hydroxyacyl-ACP dehydratase FabZ [Deltaproteobacteria bacterium]
MLPHRYPFLLVDRVLELEKDRVVAIKNVTFNEPFFQGHFPGRPVMPGVLLVEAMAQAGAFITLGHLGPDRKSLFMLAGLDKVRFRRQVVPGDQVKIEVKAVKIHRPLWKMSGQAHVDGELVAEAELSAMEVEEKDR